MHLFFLQQHHIHMSTSSGPKSRAQAHCNRFAFRHNKNSKLSKTIQLVGTAGLCASCARKVEWRKKYRQYKPLSAPRMCNGCRQRCVFAAYHTLCVSCAKARGVCEQCANVRSNTTQTQVHTDQVMPLIQSLPEREKRTVLRFVEKGGCVREALRKVGVALVEDDEHEKEQHGRGDASEVDVTSSRIVEPEASNESGSVHHEQPQPQLQPQL